VNQFFPILTIFPAYGIPYFSPNIFSDLQVFQAYDTRFFPPDILPDVVDFQILYFNHSSSFFA
jgi:hypothetical protein